MHPSINETSMNVNKEILILNSSNEKKTKIIKENPNQNKDDENYTNEETFIDNFGTTISWTLHHFFYQIDFSIEFHFDQLTF